MRKAYIILGAALMSGVVCNGCGILPTEEEFGAAPVVQEYEGSNYNKYTVVRGDMIQKESISVSYQGTREVEITGSDGQIKKVGSKEEIMPELLGAGAPCKTLTDKL